MQVRIFTISIFDTGAVQEEMNKFLRGHKVLDMKQELVTTNDGVYWCYSIRYIFGASVFPQKGVKKDYKEILTAEQFIVFSKLRECRKEISKEAAIPAYAVFTDAELSKIAELEILTAEKLKNIKGIGKNKVEKYGVKILEMLEKKKLP